MSFSSRAILLAVLLSLFGATHAAEGNSVGGVSATRAESVLGPGDQIRITVFQNPDLTVETRVSETGTITFPLIGSVRVGGLTPAGAERQIADQLRSGKFVLRPQVSVLVLTVRGSQIAVLGQVNRPGRYPVEVANLKLSDVIAQAGGITPAGSDRVTLVGKRDRREFVREIDIATIFQEGNIVDDIAVEAGDVIYAHRAAVFFVYGEVQRPGAYRLERGWSVMQALAQGGGLTQRGTERGLRVHRRDPAGRTVVKDVTLEDVVEPDDVIYVKQSLF